ncbi:hypothetical protein L6452_02866 [Arctium lappa]|uniref:Uncharacterized protein n=1 Tax=Arctium lappa TaxID=4217 RepID=A0ACB9FK41_ARCLA|nr:hypothetical protein L6452_02866 [Arctium lappa]
MDDSSHTLHSYFVDLRRWSPGFSADSRLAWIKIIGLSLACWIEENFIKIAEHWGTFINSENCIFEEAKSFLNGCILIKTEVKGKIYEYLNIKISGSDHLVLVSEVLDFEDQPAEISSYSDSDDILSGDEEDSEIPLECGDESLAEG